MKTAKKAPVAIKTYLVTAQRQTGEVDYMGEKVIELHVEGHGWCRYSWQRATIRVNGGSTSHWEYKR